MLPKLSGRCRFGEPTFAGTQGNGREAPIPAGRGAAIERHGSTLSGPSGRATASGDIAPFPGNRFHAITAVSRSAERDSFDDLAGAGKDRGRISLSLCKRVICAQYLWIGVSFQA
jgi:hypothetical protein